jgi:hypothetical protein
MAHFAFTNKRLPIACLAIAFAAIVVTRALHAAPLFYISTQATGPPAPGLLNLTNIAPNSTDMLHIWVDTDVRLSGVSVDLIESGGAIKFTDLHVPNPFLPGFRWVVLDGPRDVTDSAVKNIGGYQTPGLSGWGIGPDAPDGPNVLLASVSYMATNLPSAKSDLSLRIGSNLIADVVGNSPQVRFGTETSALVNGGAFGSGGPVGSIRVGSGIGPVITPVHLGEVIQSTPIIANLFQTGAPSTWSGLTSVAGSPAVSATLTSHGEFSWNPAGSKRGPKGNGVLYSWSATFTTAFGSTTGVAITLRLIPEPATIFLTTLAATIFSYLFRRRKRIMGHSL